MSVKVAVRVRPFNQRQKFLGCLNCIQMKQKTTILTNPRDRSQKQYQFTYDYSLWSHDGYEELDNGYLYPIDDRFVDQKRLFKELGEDILKNAWYGYNCCLFAYGQTGAGKSYSMLGYQNNKGIVPKICETIFEGIDKNKITLKKQYQVNISMLEIYNQKVQDLFIHTNKRPVNGLKIRESKKMGVYVEGISRYYVHSYAEIQKKMEQGAKNRSLASTLMNQYSSRAHTIVMIQLIQKQFITEQKMNKKTSLLNLVDLAGSERISKTGISDKDRMKQASQINKSLHTLGRVIENLAELSVDKTKNIQIPYRQSALTRILETALGGNSVTTMICAISPANDNYEQTLSTLRYADQTKKIKNKPIINESGIDKIIRELREQNQRLKQMLRLAKLKGINLQIQQPNIFSNIMEIQRQIKKNMSSFSMANQSLEFDANIIEFMDTPDPNDISVQLNIHDTMNNSTIINNRANTFLTNLNQDRLLCFKIRYSCEEELFIGNKNNKEGEKNKLVLCGLGVEDRHARIFSIRGKYYIEPLCEQAYEYTLLNGKNVDKKMEIFHNDRIIFGTNSVFLFKNFSQKIGSNSTISNEGSPKLVKSGSISQALKSKMATMSSTLDNQNTHEYSLIEQSDKDNKKTNQLTELLRKSMIQFDTQLQTHHQQSVDQKILDYQYAINERQTRMFQNLSNTTIKTTNIQVQKKLLQIQRQYIHLKQQNKKRMKQKQQIYNLQLKKIQKQKQFQIIKYQEQLKIKQLEVQHILQEKFKIEKIRDKLLSLQKYKKFGNHQIRESLPICQEEDQQNNNQNFYNQENIQSNNVNNKIQINFDNIQIQQIKTLNNNNFYGNQKNTNIIQKYIKIQSEIKQLQQKKDTLFGKNCQKQTNAILTNCQNKGLDNVENQKQSNSKHQINQLVIQKRPSSNLKFHNIFSLHIPPNPPPNSPHHPLQIISSINFIISTPPQPIPQYFPHVNSFCQQKPFTQQLKSPQNTYRYSNQMINQYYNQYYHDQISLNLSVDRTTNFMIKQEELLQKIKIYQEKLKNLQQMSKEKKQSISNIKKSFTYQFRQNFNILNQQNILTQKFDILANKQQSDHGQAQLQRKLKLNLIQCQNQNIINQRILHLRKRKCELQQLKKIFIKKQKNQLQNKLIQLIPMVQKFNLWASSMDKNIQAKIQILYHNFSNNQIIQAIKFNMDCQFNIVIKINNYQEGRTYKWPLEVFKNRFQIVQNLFQRYLQIPIKQYQQHPLQQLIDNNKNPFWDPIDFQPFAVGYLSLQSLLYGLPFDGQIRLVHKGKIIGIVHIKLQSFIGGNRIKLKQKLNDQISQNQIYDPKQLLQHQLYFVLSIQNIKINQQVVTNKIQKYFISYEIIQDSLKILQCKTQQISIEKQVIGYSMKHHITHINQNTLNYLADSPICLTLHVLFSQDNQMRNSFSSFYRNSQSIYSMSSIIQKPQQKPGSQRESLQSSMSSFQKKKSTIIMKNEQITKKIQKQYQNVYKKKQENNKYKNNKQKGKNQDCTIF